MNEIDISGLSKPAHKGRASIKLVSFKVSPTVIRDMFIGGHRFTAAESLEEKIVDAIAPNPLDAAVGFIEKLRLIGKGSRGLYGAYKHTMYFEVVGIIEAALALEERNEQAKAKL